MFLKFPFKSLDRLQVSLASLTRPTGVLRACGVCVSPQSRSLFSALFRAFCLMTSRAYLNTQKCGLFCSPIYLRQGKRLTTVGLKIVHGYLQKVSGE